MTFAAYSRHHPICRDSDKCLGLRKSEELIAKGATNIADPVDV